MKVLCLLLPFSMVAPDYCYNSGNASTDWGATFCQDLQPQTCITITATSGVRTTTKSGTDI